jgi:CotH kinase protein/Lamin Tail Domain/Concanavalin A-like lectin/glucanases superfamily
MSTYVTGSVSGFGPARENVLFPLGAWQHVAMTADGATVRVYRNGVRVGSTFTYSGILSDLVTPFAFGVKTDGTGNAADTGAPGYWDGRMDDAGLWTRALSDQEIYGIYTAGLSGLDLEQSNPTTPPAGIVSLNEFMASNSGGLKDSDGDTPDWIEIYNGLDTPQDMSGWRLTDSAGDLSKWIFPATVIPARSFLIVFASEKNRAVAGQQLHTNFKLTADGEYLALVNSTGAVVSAFAPTFPQQAVNVSFGMFRPVTESEPAGSPAYNALLRYFQYPTPGASNLGGTEALGPNVALLAHTPALPVDADAIVVTARVTPAFAPVASVTMKYRVNFAAESTLAMLDDGAGGDALAGDGIFSATIPASASTPGQMVRWYVTAADNAGKTSRAPLFPEPSTTPEYAGTVIGDASVTTPLPQLLWFVQNAAAAETQSGTPCSVFYLGELYDNVDVRIRGGTAISWPKKSYKLKFNDGYHFRFKAGVGRVDEVNLNATYTDKSYNRAVLTYESLRDAGIPTPEIFQVHVRQNGVFYSVALMTEQIEGDFLSRWNLDRDGALYKGGPGSTYDTVTSFEKKNREAEGTADIAALISNLGLTGTALETFVFDQVDVPAMVNYMTGMAITQDIDGTDKNHFVFRDTERTREWRMLPYDLDLTFGPNALNTDTIVFNQQNTASPACASHPFIGARPYLLHGGKYNRLLESIVNTPRTRTMLLRRLRSLTDAQLGTTYFQSRIDSLVALLGPDVSADRAKWGASAHFGGTTYTLQQANDRIKNEYLTPRVGFLRGTTIAGVLTANPAAQPAAPPINFGTVHFFPPANQAEEYFSLVNPNAFAVDLTGWSITGEVNWTFRPGTVLLAGETMYLTPDAFAFRSRAVSPKGGEGRLVQGNYDGQLSARGGTLTLFAPGNVQVATTTYTGTPTPAQQSLRVTEVNYNSAPGGAFAQRDYEFIELRNIGATPLTLDGIRIAGGVDFTFPPGTLAPGGYIVVASNPAALASRYGAVPVAGEFTGHLDEESAKERIHVIDASGENVLDFDYQPAWLPVTNGGGFTLTVVDENAPHPDWDLASQWRLSGKLHGTPGGPDITADTDADGMPDAFEGTYSFDPTNSADGALDTDGDGQSNAAEAQSATNPRDPASSFRITSIAPAVGGGYTLSFAAAANRTYAIQRSSDLTAPGGGWMTIHTEPAAAARTIEHTDDPGGPRQFYRAVTPAP